MHALTTGMAVTRRDLLACAHVGQAQRVTHITSKDDHLRALVERMIWVSLEGLPLMFRPQEHAFAYTRKLGANGSLRLSGTSLRYSAIVLLGAHGLDEDLQRSLLGGESAREFCTRLAQEALKSSNLGAVALVVWAGAEIAHELLPVVLARLAQVAERDQGHSTVEWAWVVSALAAARREAVAPGLAAHAAAKLLAAFSPEAGIFPHRLSGAPTSARSHVACFADQVYPIQALTRHHVAYRSSSALDAADRCAEQICRAQGEAGQWWWHYDTRTGQVIEGYPVYSVHQDGMGPMALLDLAEAGGGDHSEAVGLGLRWLEIAPEVGRSLIDEQHAIIWRKVGRTDPRKLVRGMRAFASRTRPGLRVPLLDAAFPARQIDFESRPYELGWVLHAWLNGLGRCSERET